MGYEKTPPADKLIFVTAIGSSLLLLGLIPLFHGYFNQMVAEQHQVKVVEVPNTLREEVMARQQQNLEAGAVPIDQAARVLGTAGRASSPTLAPQPSTSFDAVEGWNQLPNAAAKAEAQAAAAAAAAEATARDAGVASEAPAQ